MVAGDGSGEDTAPHPAPRVGFPVVILDLRAPQRHAPRGGGRFLVSVLFCLITARDFRYFSVDMTIRVAWLASVGDRAICPRPFPRAIPSVPRAWLVGLKLAPSPARAHQRSQGTEHALDLGGWASRDFTERPPYIAGSHRRILKPGDSTMRRCSPSGDRNPGDMGIRRWKIRRWAFLAEPGDGDSGDRINRRCSPHGRSAIRTSGDGASVRIPAMRRIQR